MKQYLEYQEGKSSKFWQIELEGQFLHLQYGKLGSKGKYNKKDLKTAEKAALAFKKEILKKKDKGYVDPQHPIPALPLHSLAVKDDSFQHDHAVEAVYYYEKEQLVLTATATHFYCWTTEGVLLDHYQCSENPYFFGTFSFLPVPHSSQLLLHKKDSLSPDEFYFFDCSQQTLHLIRKETFTPPPKGYYRHIDLDEQYIYYGYTGGFMLLNYNFEVIKTLSSPQKEDNSNATFVSAAGQWVIFVEYAGYGKKGDKVLVMDLEGETICQFEAPIHHSTSGMMACFNKAGTQLYSTVSNNYETKLQVWDLQTVTLLKELSNYSSNGGVLSFGLSLDEEWLLIRVAGIDLICWNLEEERVAWVNSNQDLKAHFAFAPSAILYQSVGNRVLPINQNNGEILKAIQGLSDQCRRLFYDNKQQQLWAVSGKTTFCFAPNGALITTLDANDFIANKVEGKALIKRRLRNHEESYAWLNLTTLEETPILSGSFRTVDYNQKYLLTAAGYFSNNEKLSRLWSSSGRELRSMNPTQGWSLYWWQEQKFIATKGKKIDLWEMGEKKPYSSLKNAHSKEIKKVIVASNQHTFLSYTDTDIKLWDGETDTPLFWELVDSPPVKVLTKPFLEEYLLFTQKGGVYSLHPSTLAFKELARLSHPIQQATLTAKGQLYAAASNSELLKADLSPYLNLLDNSATTEQLLSINWDNLGEKPNAATLLDFMTTLPWQQLQEQDFLQLRSLLQQQESIGAAHHYFTQEMLKAGALLRHEFAHEEAISSFALSPDGAYLAVGTWVGANYEEDGTVQIWEVATGRAVNLLKKNYGGIGWPDYYHMLQWSPSGQYLGAGLNTNCVAKLNPFSSAANPMALACITNGWSRPPAWCWQGEQDAFAISCWHDSPIPLGLTSNKNLYSYEDQAQWMAPSLPPALDKQLTEEDLQPYTWCRASQDGQLVYGYNNHGQAFAIDTQEKQVVWLKNVSTPIAFSAVSELMAYQQGSQLLIANLRTGVVQQKYAYDKTAAGLQFSPDGQWIAVYEAQHLHLFQVEKALQGEFILEDALQLPYSFSSELTPVQFSPCGEKLATLTNSGLVEIWQLATLTLVKSFQTAAKGIYWGVNLIGVSPYQVSFYQEDGTLIREQDKALQVAAYNEVYEQAKPLETKKEDFAEWLEIPPYAPFYHKNKKEWLAALSTGLVISASGNPESLDSQLSYTFANKYAWPYSWGGATALYPHLYAAKEDTKLGLTEQEKAQISAPKVDSKKEKATLKFKKGGHLLDLIQVHQDSLSNLDKGWNYHISKHNGILARKLVALGAYQQAIQVANHSPEWYKWVANLGFLAVELARAGAAKEAELAFEKGVKALAAGTEEDRTTWAATFVYAPLAAAAQLLGKTALSQEYFQLAQQELAKESNTFEKYSHLATAYLLSGQVDKALEVVNNGPTAGGWFSTYQMDFLLLLLRMGHIEEALSYFNSSLEIYGSIDEFELLDAGLLALLSHNKYKEAIAWIAKFEGLSVDGAEEVLVQQLHQAQEVALVTEWLLERLGAVQAYGNSSIKYLYFLSGINPQAAQQQLDKLPDNQTIYYWGAYYEYLGKVHANLEPSSSIPIVFESIKDREHQFLYLWGQLQQLNSSQKEKQLSLLQQASVLLTQLGIASTNLLHYHTQLGILAHQLGVPALFEQHNSLVFTTLQHKKGLAHYEVRPLMEWYVQADLPQEAHALFQQLTPSERKYVMRAYALVLAQQGYLSTAAQLLQTLPNKDLNDQASAVMEVIQGL